METYEEIQQVLEEDGIELDFDSFIIWGILGSSTTLLRQEPSFAEIEQQEFNFYVSTQDCVDNDLTQDIEFKFLDDTYEYTFVTLRGHIPFTDGWSRIPAMFISKEVL